MSRRAGTNRRRRIARAGWLRRVLGRKGNRRLQPKVPEVAAPARARPERPRRDWAAAGRTLLGVALFSAKVIGVTVGAAGLGVAAAHGYKRARSSTYFDVHTIVVRGQQRADEAQLQALVAHARGQMIYRVDLGQIAERVRRNPWIRDVRVTRELPSTLRVVVSEHRPTAAVLLAADEPATPDTAAAGQWQSPRIYLADADGRLFKAATTAEAAKLPVITGPTRDAYRRDPQGVQRQVRRAQAFLVHFGSRPQRPAIGEIHIGAHGEITLYTRKGGAALHLGVRPGDDRLRRLDAVWAGLSREGQLSRVRAVFADNLTNPNRVVVRRLPAPAPAPVAETRPAPSLKKGTPASRSHKKKVAARRKARRG